MAGFLDVVGMLRVLLCYIQLEHSADHRWQTPTGANAKLILSGPAKFILFDDSSMLENGQPKYTRERPPYLFIDPGRRTEIQQVIHIGVPPNTGHAKAKLNGKKFTLLCSHDSYDLVRPARVHGRTFPARRGLTSQKNVHVQ